MSYQLIIVPIIAAIAAQIIKMIMHGIKGRFCWGDLNSYGGMPSSHAALVTALFAMAGYTEGWNSASAAIALILAVIVLRDASGFRRVLGKHAKEINQIIHGLPSISAGNYPRLEEELGHTPLELFLGALIGALASVLAIIFF